MFTPQVLSHLLHRQFYAVKDMILYLQAKVDLLDSNERGQDD